MMTIKVTYGPDQTSIVLPAGSNVGNAINNQNVKETLQYGESIRVLLDGSAVDNCMTLRDGDELEVVTKANAKA